VFEIFNKSIIYAPNPTPFGLLRIMPSVKKKNSLCLRVKEPCFWLFLT